MKPTKLIDMELSEDSLLPKTKVDVGLVAEQMLKPLISSKRVSALQVLDIRVGVSQFIAKTVTKLLAKAPLKYPLVRHIACLDPHQMATASISCLKKMKLLLPLLVDAGRVEGGLNACDEIVRQFSDFLDTVVKQHHSVFLEFTPIPDKRTDTLLHSHLADKPKFRALFQVVHCLLLLSQGQASVERGFSINREIEQENMLEWSIVAQRLTYDYVQSVGGLLSVPVTKQLLLSAASARQQYMAHLEEEKRKVKEDSQSRKRKRVLDEIDIAKKKKKRLEADIAELVKSADDFALEAEKTQQMVLVTKSNSLRQTAKRKQEELTAASTLLEEKIEALKSCN